MELLPRQKANLHKLFYKIGEISDITDVESHVLRYWESEFPFLQPRKNKTGQRVYTRKDLDLVLQIKNLLYEEKYTIAGVRNKFKGNVTGKNTVSIETIQRVRKSLKEILNTLK